MHEDIIRQRFEDTYKIWGEQYLEHDGRVFTNSGTQSAWIIFRKGWQAAYASMSEIEEQPELDHIKVYPDHPLFKQLLLGKLVRRSIPVEDLTDTELALMEKQVSEMPEDEPANCQVTHNEIKTLMHTGNQLIIALMDVIDQKPVTDLVSKGEEWNRIGHLILNKIG